MPLHPIESEEALTTRLGAEGPLLAYLSRPECNVCQVLRPRVEALLDEADIPGVYVDVSALPSVAAQRLVFAVPTLIVYYDGREARRFGRHLSMAELEGFLERVSA